MNYSEQVRKLYKAADLVDGVSDGPSRELAVKMVREVAKELMSPAPISELPQVEGIDWWKCYVGRAAVFGDNIRALNETVDLAMAAARRHMPADPDDESDLKRGIALMRAAQKVEPTLNAFAAAQLAVLVEMRALRREIRSARTPDLTQLVDNFRMGPAGPERPTIDEQLATAHRNAQARVVEETRPYPNVGKHRGGHPDGRSGSLGSSGVWVEDAAGPNIG